MLVVLFMSPLVLLATGLPVEPSNNKRYENPLTHGDVGKKLVLSICIFVATLMVLSIIFFVFRKFRPEADTREDNHPLTKMADREDNPSTRSDQPIREVVGDISYYHNKVWQERNNGQRKNPVVTQPVVPTPPAPVVHPHHDLRGKLLPSVPKDEFRPTQEEVIAGTTAIPHQTDPVRKNRERRLTSKPGATHWVRHGR